MRGGNSEASTVPASTPEAAAMAKRATAELQTPPGRAKHEPPSDSSAPKLSRAVQSRPILEDPNHKPKKSRTETSAEQKTAHPSSASAVPPGTSSQPIRTAAKAKPAAKANTSTARGKSAKAKVEQIVPAKVEHTTRHSKVAVAVQESIRRGATTEIPTPPSDAKAAAKQKAASPKDDAGKHAKCITKSKGSPKKHGSTPAPATPPSDSGEDDPDDPQNDPDAVEKERLRKACHARFMRFSRSLKSVLF